MYLGIFVKNSENECIKVFFNKNILKIEVHKNEMMCVGKRWTNLPKTFDMRSRRPSLRSELQTREVEDRAAHTGTKFRASASNKYE